MGWVTTHTYSYRDIDRIKEAKEDETDGSMLLCHVVQEHEVSHGPPRESFTDPFGNSNHCTLFPQKGNLFCSVSTMASFLSVFIIVVLGICSEVLFAEKSVNSPNFLAFLCYLSVIGSLILYNICCVAHDL